MKTKKADLLKKSSTLPKKKEFIKLSNAYYKKRDFSIPYNFQWWKLYTLLTAVRSHDAEYSVVTLIFDSLSQMNFLR